MNGTRLLLSLLLTTVPALALPAARRTGRPRHWATLFALSLGAGFVLIEAALVHAFLPHLLALVGLTQPASRCRAMGGHLSGATPLFGFPAGFLALTVGWRSVRRGVDVLRVKSMVRRGARSYPTSRIAGYDTVTLPLRDRWAVAVPGASPPVVLSTSLVETLEGSELGAVIRHEMAHVRKHHDRFVLVGTTASAGLWFLPWIGRASAALRLTLERWADEEAASSSDECRRQLCSALRKLTQLSPSSMANSRIAALMSQPPHPMGTAIGYVVTASAVIP